MIGWDIDDTLAQSAPSLIAYSNEHFGTALTLDDYDDSWCDMWGISLEEGLRRQRQYVESGALARLMPHQGAQDAVAAIAEHHIQVAITARRRELAEVTRYWVGLHFNGLFQGIYHAGLWDNPTVQSATATKAAICQELGVTDHVDDQTKHCFAVAAAGIGGVLFGNHPWNRTDQLPQYVTRTPDMGAVRAYFL